MSWSGCWIAVKGQVRDRICSQLGLQVTGERSDDGEWPMYGITLRKGWYVVVDETADELGNPEFARELSVGTMAIWGGMIEDGLLAEVCCYTDGRQTWRIGHGHDLDNTEALDAEGQLPECFKRIRARAARTNDPSDLFEVPLDVSYATCGFRLDEANVSDDDDLYEELVSLRPVPPHEWHFMISSYQLITDDVPRALAFYRDALGCDVRVPHPDVEQPFFNLGVGKACAARPGCKSGWLPVVYVDHVGSRAALAEALGATLVTMDPRASDARAILRDPWGARFVLASGVAEDGKMVDAVSAPASPPTPEPVRPQLDFNERLVIPYENRFSRQDLLTTDVAASQAFYASLLDWTHVAMRNPLDPDSPTYLHCDVSYTASLRRAPPGLSPCWVPVFQVTDPVPVAEVVPSLGGSVLVAPTEAMGLGLHTLLEDPTGALFIVRQG